MKITGNMNEFLKCVERLKKLDEDTPVIKIRGVYDGFVDLFTENTCQLEVPSLISHEEGSIFYSIDFLVKVLKTLKSSKEITLEMKNDKIKTPGYEFIPDGISQELNLFNEERTGFLPAPKNCIKDFYYSALPYKPYIKRDKTPTFDFYLTNLNGSPGLITLSRVMYGLVNASHLKPPYYPIPKKDILKFAAVKDLKKPIFTAFREDAVIFNIENLYFKIPYSSESIGFLRASLKGLKTYIEKDWLVFKVQPAVFLKKLKNLKYFDFPTIEFIQNGDKLQISNPRVNIDIEGEMEENFKISDSKFKIKDLTSMLGVFYDSEVIDLSFNKGVIRLGDAKKEIAVTGIST